MIGFTLFVILAVDARAIMETADARHRLPVESVRAVMTLQAKSGASERRVYVSTAVEDDRAGDKMVIRFREPADVAATAFLTVQSGRDEDEQWLYLPSFKKTRRVGVAELGDRFVGSDLFYEDLRRHHVADYQHTLIREENIDDVPCWVIESTPSAERVRRESPYGKSVSWVRKDNYFVVRSRHFDKQGRPAKEMTATRLVRVNDRVWRADRLEVVDVERKHRTVLEVTARDLRPTLSRTTFTPQGLAAE